MKRYIKVNEDNSINSMGEIWMGDGSIEIDVEDDFNELSIGKYKYTDGILVKDPDLVEQDKKNQQQAEKLVLRSIQLQTALDEVIVPLVANKTFTATTAAKLSSFAPFWSDASVKYDPGKIVTDPYDNKTYICNPNQGHTSQAGWDPHLAPSLWSLIKVAPDGNREWVDPTGAHNDYAKDELCWYPDYALGSLYKSKQDGNVWPPNDTAQSTWYLVQSM